MAGPRPKWPACSASPARPSPSGCGGSAKADRTRSTTAPAVPCAAPARPVSCKEAAICAARRSFAWGPHRIGWRLGIARSTASRGSIAPQAEWAYLRPYYSNRERLNALPSFLAHYNHRRAHGGIGGLLPPPACKQRPWELHLAVGAILSFPSSFAPVELGAMPAPRSVVVAIRPASLTSIGGCVVSHATRHGQPNNWPARRLRHRPRREGEKEP